MQNWEYRHVVLFFKNYGGSPGHSDCHEIQKTDDIAAFLNRAGNEGWELIATDERQPGSLGLFFKRPAG